MALPIIGITGMALVTFLVLLSLPALSSAHRHNNILKSECFERQEFSGL